MRIIVTRYIKTNTASFKLLSWAAFILGGSATAGEIKWTQLRNSTSAFQNRFMVAAGDEGDCRAPCRQIAKSKGKIRKNQMQLNVSFKGKRFSRPTKAHIWLIHLQETVNE